MGNYTAEDYIDSPAVFDEHLYLSRPVTQIYGAISLGLTGLVLGLRLFIFPHLVFDSLKSFCFTSLSLLFISITQLIQNVCQLYHGYLMVQAFAKIPLITMYSCAIFCAAWLCQSLLYLTLVPATIVQTIGSTKLKARTVFLIYLLICLSLTLLFFAANYPPFHQSILYFDFPMWMINGFIQLPLTWISLQLNHALDIFVAFVMLISLIILLISCPFTGEKTQLMNNIRKEVFWTAIYFCVTTAISISRGFVINDQNAGKSKDGAALCYLGSILWGLGKPVIYMIVHRKSVCFRKLLP
ncbi:unnamed protein product, partial [Mesorhabditis belari]|uniref:Uncharacterized protein n=1 Tax=Mesorhabditis belari TaxID=2138241 RepID=A0AAF3J608_9BILA